jgi:hypothetical protein
LRSAVDESAPDLWKVDLVHYEEKPKTSIVN